jgi:hypothetical protein
MTATAATQAHNFPQSGHSILTVGFGENWLVPVVWKPTAKFPDPHANNLFAGNIATQALTPVSPF